jgi:hypothetical protein
MTPILARLAAEAATFTPSIAGRKPFELTAAVEWLPTGQKWSFKGDVPHISASSAKFIWAAAALRAGHTPAELEKCADPTFVYSCNNTAGSLIDAAGGVAAVNKFTADVVGNSKDAMTLCAWSSDVKRVDAACGTAICPLYAQACGGNYFTASAAVRFLEKAWKGDLLPPDKTAALMRWATMSPRSGFAGWIGTQLPPEVRKTINHKPGAIAPGCCGIADPAFSYNNEIAIVHSPRGDYAVALMLAHAQSWCQEIATLEWGSCVVYHALVRDVPDPFAAGCTHAPSTTSCKDIPEVCPTSPPVPACR